MDQQHTPQTPPAVQTHQATETQPTAKVAPAVQASGAAAPPTVAQATAAAKRGWWAAFKHELSRRTEPSVFIVLIMVDKVFRALLGIALGIGLFSLLRSQAPIAFLEHLVSQISIGTIGRTLETSIEKLANLKHGTLIALALGAYAYAGLEFVEGIGLLLHRRWAEYLTLIATFIPIPFIEIPELFAKFTYVRLGALLINIAIVIYLIVARKLFRLAEEKIERASEERVSAS